MVLLKYLKASKDGLPDPKGSLSSAIPSRAITSECWSFMSQKSFTEFLDIVTFTIKIHLQGISNPPCGISEEYLLPQITTQSIVPFSIKNKDAS